MKMFRPLAAALLPLALFIAEAQGQSSFPERPVTMVVGFSPGSSIDLVARTVAKQMSQTLRYPVLVENKPGAGGNVAAEMVARARPDGGCQQHCDQPGHVSEPEF